MYNKFVSKSLLEQQVDCMTTILTRFSINVISKNNKVKQIKEVIDRSFKLI